MIFGKGCVLFVLSTLASSALAFSSNARTNAAFLPTSIRQQYTTSSLHYTLYGGEEGGMSDNDSNPMGITLSYNDDESRCMAEKLSSDTDMTGMLTRIAAGFSQSAAGGTPIEIEHIHHINVLSVDNHHIEIEAFVCDDSEQCVNVLVPIEFIQECATGEDEECILSNLDELDHQAEVKIEEIGMEVVKIAEELRLDEDFSLSVEEQGNMELPSWWIAPMAHGLSEGCSNIQSVLQSKSFEDELIALVSHALEALETNTCYYLVQKAVVIAVGPAGICLRARVRKNALYKEETIEVIDVPIEFQSGPVEDSQSLLFVIEEMLALTGKHSE